ncbi:protein ImuB [Kibdelosporangium aridum]|uniref:Protein ImuB n=2 Tax=Kibdelosporangium aridum TaxID=2030 RepID=A0A1W2CTX0_KIBAR|nr:protein ImuB [Kibdelosporangium aridum]
MRMLVVWCPDWLVVAAASGAGLPLTIPMAVVAANRVVASSAVARAEGIRRDMRRREAQGRCPELVVFEDDPVRDARLFEAVAAAVEELAVGVEIVRPGLVAVPARGPAGYFGGEEAAAERLIDQVADRAGVECQVGVADGLFAATLAAHRGLVVEPGRSAEFLAPLAVNELRQPGGPDRAELIDLLRRLGLRTLGAFAAITERDVATRFDTDAVQAHRLARGLDERPPSRRRPPPDLSISTELDPPVERVDAAAFVAKSLAERLHAGLAAHGLACTRLGIYARSERDEELGRVWRCAEPLTPNGIADRVRWQLDGWLRVGGPTAGIRTLWLEPEEVVEGKALQLDLWRGEGHAEAAEKAGRAMVRVQGLLGPEAVCTPVLGGGRDPSERARLVPWGEELTPAADPGLPWPGHLPAPSPAVVFPDPVPATVFGEAGEPVHVTDRDMLTAAPATVGVNGGAPRPVAAWAGPWIANERWWNREPRCHARLQVLIGAQPAQAALLLGYHQGKWVVYGHYD